MSAAPFHDDLDEEETPTLKLLGMSLLVSPCCFHISMGVFSAPNPDHPSSGKCGEGREAQIPAEGSTYSFDSQYSHSPYAIKPV